MLNNIIEILSVIGGIGFLVWAWRSVAQQGKNGEVSSLIGRSLIKPFNGSAEKR
jgi:hypothetical protein